MNIRKAVPLYLTAIAMAVLFSCQNQDVASPDLSANKAESLPGQALGAASGASAEWSYDEEHGPEQWCFLSDDFDLCCEDRTEATQSPIDIVTEETVVDRLRTFRYRYFLSGLNVENNGHTIKASVAPGRGRIWLRRKQYNLLQFHFHAPSEHTVNGEEFPMEMHMVHQADDGSIAVVGVLIREGKRLYQLDDIWADLPQEEGDEMQVRKFRLRSLLPDGDHWWRRNYRYSGSFTTPPCTEDIRWLVFAQPREMSAEQIEAFKELFSGDHFPDGNRRPVQPLNGRTVHADSWTFK